MNVRELFFKSEPKLESNLPFPRCQHRSPAGRQCSQPICSTSPEFCFTHKPKPEDLLIAELTEAAGALSNPEDIHRFLTRVTLFRIQGRLTPKEACSYAYMCQILQRGQREIAFHHKLREDRAAREAEQARVTTALFSSWNIPRPDRSSPDDPPNSASPEPTTSTNANSSSTPIATISSEKEPHQTPAESESPLGHPDRRPAPFADRSGGTVATNSTPTPTDGTNAPSIEKSPSKKSKRSSKTSAAELSESSISSTSQTSPAPTPPRPLPPDFYNHFFPIDFTLPPGAQDHAKNIPHPDAAECARRNARRGLGSSRPRRYVSNLLSLWRR